MQRFHIWALLATGMFGLTSAAAFAADEPSKPEDLFKKLDKNGDDRIAPDEVAEEQGKFFDRLVRLGDKDDNGELTKEEFLSALENSDRPVQGGGLDRGPGPGGPGGGRPMFDPKQMMERFDKNKDGKLTKDELPEEGPGRFLRALLDRSGKDALAAEDLERMRGFGGDRPGPRFPRVFERLDQNNDGRISREELEGIRKLFDELDENRDGQLDPRELLGPPPGPPDGRVPPGRGPEGDRRPDGGRRPEGGRPREGDRPREGGRPRDGDRPREGDRRREVDRPREAERRPSERRDNAERKPSAEVR